MSETKIWNQGFPADTTLEDDGPVAVAAMVDYYANTYTPALAMVGDPVSITDVSTEESLENNERVIRVEALFDPA